MQVVEVAAGDGHVDYKLGVAEGGVEGAEAGNGNLNKSKHQIQIK